MAESLVINGTCPHDCPDSCGWQVTVTGSNGDRRAVQMRGNPDHPFSQGELCPKVNRYLDRVYDERRILHPLRRVGPKGSGDYERITWDDALAEVAARFQQAIERYGPETLMPYSDAGNQSMLAIYYPNRFWHALGATRLERALCGPTVGAGVSMTMGTALCLDPMEIRHSKLILIWGTNTRLTNRHLWPTIEAARADGAQVVVIDPLRTMTAEAADWFIQPLPGTDTALMLAMIHVLIRDNLVDHDWVTAHTLGYDDLAAHVADWTPLRAADICGLDAGEIERLATMYGTIKPSVIRTLIGAEHHENGAMIYRTMACLPALVGAWQYRGGGLARSVGSWCGLLIDDHASIRRDLLGAAEPRWVNMSRLGEALTDPAMSPPITAMLVWNANPVVSTPNVELIRQGLLRDDLFVVAHEQYLTDTARYADIILPATTQIEAVDVTPAWGHLWLGWNEPAIDPVGESVSNSELHRRLAAAMGLTDPALFVGDIDALAEMLPTVDLNALRA
ncbi:MAG TPA: molybdopterin-dependent oxidoreductase, partial [Ilumatobacteraceae bacterium]|nr:molybdopterin-dependent oxidoreductase [Ilumatobacteraceae bacterium]